MKITKIYQAWLLSGLFVTLVVVLGLSNPAKAEQRIVSIDGAMTEIVFALGKGADVVGRDTTSDYPAEAAKLPDVGYMRALSAEGILSLNPTLVLATSDAKPQKVLMQLKQAGVNVEIIPNQYTLQGVVNKIESVAKVLNETAKGQQLIDELNTQVADAQNLAKQQSQQGQLSGIFVLNARKGNLMVAGNHSRANTLMEMAALNNPVATEFNGYKPLTPEAAIQYNPAFILTMQHSVQSVGGLKQFEQSKVLAMTEAGKNKRYIVLDNSDLNFGPRLGQALTKLVKSAYSQ
jgi:iron complex transport system substrate-binding protein